MLGGNSDDDMMLVKTALGDVSECDPEGMTCLVRVANSGMVKAEFAMPHTESPNVSSINAEFTYDDLEEPTDFDRECYEEGEWRPNDPKGSDTRNKTNLLAGQSQGVDMYPNPASQEVYIELPDLDGASAEVSIFDFQGRLIREETLGSAAGRHRISIEDLPSGAYLFELRVGELPPVRRRISIQR